MIALVAGAGVIATAVIGAVRMARTPAQVVKPLPPPEGRYKPEAREHNAKNLAAARGVWRA